MVGRKGYPAEFREEAVRLVRESGKSIAYVNRKVYHRDGEFLYHRTAGGPPWVQQRAFSAWRAGHA